ncbi:MAG: SMP-30/gluconolactonase/LRE family protein [Pseudomonadota bacterium]
MHRRTITAAAVCLLTTTANAQEFTTGQPLGSVNEAGERMEMSDNVRVFGSFHFTESCTFDPARNLILSMNAGDRSEGAEEDGYVSLINPDGSVHTSKWIGVTRDGLSLNNPIGSAIRNGVLYTVDSGFVRSFDLETGRPLQSIQVPDAGFLNGIAVDDDGTAYVSETRPKEVVYKVTPDGESTVFAQGEPLALPNGVAMDNDGNIVVVNIGSNAVITYNPAGDVVQTEYAAESGGDGVVVLPDDTKYVSSVRYGSVSKLVPGQEAEVIATGIPSAASMCYDSVQNQLVIPMNPNNALAFIEL